MKTVCSCKLLVSGSLNYEDQSSHEIILEVSDGTHSRTSNFTITVLDQNDPPKNVTIQGSLSGRANENTNNELVGELVTNDDDRSQSHVYSLNDSTRFTIKGNKLYTSRIANLDYEARQEFKIAVTSTDSGRPPLFFEQTLTIEVSFIPK